MEQLFVIKIGGNVIDDDASLQSFLKTFSEIKGSKILVHGGGKIATKIGEKLSLPVMFRYVYRLVETIKLSYFSCFANYDTVFARFKSKRYGFMAV